jgi:hypothetical protein
MTVPAPPTLTPAPSPAPTRTDPANFNVRADAYHTWLVPHVNTQLPAVITWITARQNDVIDLVGDAEDQVALAADQVTLASNQVTLAESAVAAATSAANASIWVSGQTYAIGNVRFSPINFFSYRRKTTGAGTTDPSLDLTNWALVAGTGNVTTDTPQIITGKKTFSGTSSEIAIVLSDAAEVATISATAATGTINYDITTQSVLYYTSNASGNWTLNFRASSGTSLNTALAIGQSVTMAFLVTQGATAFFNNVIQVDGATVGVTTRWLGGAPTAGNSIGIDSYRYLIIKTGNATFTVLASVTQFKV